MSQSSHVHTIVSLVSERNERDIKYNKWRFEIYVIMLYLNILNIVAIW